MTRLVVVGCLLLFLCGCSQNSEIESLDADDSDNKTTDNRTPDGRYGTRCTGWSRDSRELCQVSIYRIIATPERYDGKFIDIRGYLIDVGGGPMIFPSPDRVDIGVPSEAIEILGKLPPELEAEVRNGVWPVVAAGTFDARYQGSVGPVLGALRVEDIGRVTSSLHSSAP
jgi:hypothetical protein